MQKWYPGIVFMFMAAEALAAFEPRVASPRGAAFGGALCGAREGCWGVLGNPSSILGGTGGMSAAAWASPGLFMMPELGEAACCLTLTGEKWGGGTGVRSFGSELYREIVWSGAIALSLHESVVGVSFTYSHLSMRNNGGAGALNFTVGARIAISRFVDAYLRSANPAGGTIGKCREPLPQLIAAGVTWSILPGLMLLLEGRKESWNAIAVTVGGEWQPLDCLAIRGGTSSESTSASCGCGISLLGATLDYSLSWHAKLGFTHMISLGIHDLI